MTLRVRLALALSLLTAIAVTAMALVGYRTTATRLYQEIDRSLSSSSVRFADPDGRYAAQVCGRLGTNVPDDGTGGPIVDLPGTAVQCLDRSGVRYAASSAEPLPIDSNDVLLAGRGAGSSLHTVADDRILTVALSGGGAVQLSRELDEVQHVLANLRVRFAVIGASITVLAALVGWWIASRVTRPVTRLTAATEAIAESGRLDVDVPPGGSDETGRLARSFATMLDALRRSREQQQRLAQDAGHELRTPLTSLRTNVEVLRRHPELEAATRDRVLGDIHSELRELTDVTNELVALATEEADDERTQVVDVAALAQRAAARTERRRRRSVVVDAEPWSVSGQPRQLLRVLDNVLDNAAKFDRSTEPIEVLVRPGTIAVRDHGAGIEPRDLIRVFDRFYRAPGARAQPGSGLGLAIANDVVRRHGGTISAANHPDGGALITISLPLVDPGVAGSTTSPPVTVADGAPPMSHPTLT
jgi:two-component system sensor histidine kinase MprB